jgi:hypothetical protein
MALPPNPMGSLIDSGIMAPNMDAAQVDIPVDMPQDFSGGAEVIDDGLGGATVQALMGRSRYGGP